MTDYQKYKQLQKRREAIAFDYLKSKGLPANLQQLTFEQIMEIQSLEAWKNVPVEIELGG